MSNYYQRVLPDESETLEVAGRLAAELAGEELIFLRGELGAGKTTFCRGLIRRLGHAGAVKSPTFTLVEPYVLEGGLEVFHFDLYRLGDPSELEYIGIDDYLEGRHLCLVEWPERGEGFLPACDLQVTLELAGDGRRLTIEANSEHGEQIIQRLSR